MGTPDTANVSKRRSTRVAQAIFFKVVGVDGNGQPFEEQTGTLEVGFQGCRYFSRYEVPKDSWLTFEIPAGRENAPARSSRARVAWVRKSRKLQGIFQVGVEFETPGNVWGLPNPPEDWCQPGAPGGADPAVFEREMNELLALASTGTYYQLLRASPESTHEQVRRGYFEFARKFHPDLHMDHPEWSEPLHKLMEALTLAYKTLTDQAGRAEYDKRLSASGGYTLGRQQSDLQKTADQCMSKARECLRAQNRGGAILWLRNAVELEPTSAVCHTLLARSLSAIVPFRREAVEHFEKAIELDSWNVEARFHLAGLYEELGLPWRARPHYQKILEIDPVNRKVQERLRVLDADSGESGKRSFIDRILRHPR